MQKVGKIFIRSVLKIVLAQIGYGKYRSKKLPNQVYSLFWII